MAAKDLLLPLAVVFVGPDRTYRAAALAQNNHPYPFLIAYSFDFLKSFAKSGINRLPLVSAAPHPISFAIMVRFVGCTRFQGRHRRTT
jgi:hypothetical protein